MNKYLNSKDFIDYLREIKYDIPVKIYQECIEDNSVETYTFMRTKFNGNTIILYDSPNGMSVGIIQDTPVAPWDDYVEGVYEDLTINNEYQLFIKTE
jgi:hypothetical protein